MKNLSLFTLVLAILSTVSLNAQNVKVDNYDIEVKEVVQKKSVGTLSPEKGNKYIGIEMLITDLSKENPDFDLSDLKLKSADGEHEALFIKPSARYSTIDVSKPKSRLFFAQVEKSFTSGNVYYNNELVGSIELTEGIKKGEFLAAK